MTIVRDMVGGTLGIAVDLWDGEVTVGAITARGRPIAKVSSRRYHPCGRGRDVATIER